MISFGYRSVILLLGGLNGLILAGLLFRTRANVVANRLLASLLLCFVARLVPYMIGYAGFYDAYPWLSFAPFDARLAFGPLLWLYVRRLTSGRLPRRWWLHLLPAAAKVAFDAIVFVSLSVPEKNDLARIVDRWIEPTVVALTFASLAWYGWRTVRERREYQAWLENNVSNLEPYTQKWLGRLLVLLGATMAVWAAFALVNAFVARLDYFAEFPQYVWLSGLVYWLGLAGWQHSGVMYPVPEAVESGPRDSHIDQSIQRRDWTEFGAQIDSAVREGRLWRNPNLSLSLLAKSLATNTAYVSRALNQGLGLSFNEYVNGLRVAEVVAALESGDQRDLLAVAFQAGFNSKASFNRAFKRATGLTPSAFRAASIQAKSQVANPSD